MERSKIIEVIGLRILEILEKQAEESGIEITQYLAENRGRIELRIVTPEISADEVAEEKATPLELEELQADVFDFVMNSIAKKNKPTLLS